MQAIEMHLTLWCLIHYWEWVAKGLLFDILSRAFFSDNEYACISRSMAGDTGNSYFVLHLFFMLVVLKHDEKQKHRSKAKTHIKYNTKNGLSFQSKRKDQNLIFQLIHLYLSLSLSCCLLDFLLMPFEVITSTSAYCVTLLLNVLCRVFYINVSLYCMRHVYQML